MLRKPLVNDVLRSLACCMRTGQRDHLFPILGFQVPQLFAPSIPTCGPILAAFTCWGFSVQRDERVVVRNVTALRSWCAAFSPEERDYLQQLLDKYYGFRL